ncbi:uncharacterized membrane protein YciS (DUF1049 family) [Permianibacter aggregans]|uniref:Uncharacterized membrane protein YciS (DUF1049 family) n=1 Tax=Permianibacter aggregans TaxID=1510150 RepID=A0A4R6UYF6_9GAMM|nr:uncharacterized membrane protein YciS (DUF1049 family) [Permianibacter aggregans]
MKQALLLIFVIILLVAGWMFSAANGDDVTVRYLVGEQTGRLSYWLLGCFLIGFLVGVVYCGWGLVKARWSNRRLRDKLAQQEKEIQRLTGQLSTHTTTLPAAEQDS